MLVKFVGQNTGKVYAKGRKVDCLRTLGKEYPTTEVNGWNKGRRAMSRVLPEPILIRRMEK